MEGKDEVDSTDEIEITPEMVEAAEEVIWGKVDSTSVGPLFSASDLALEIFLAMWRRRIRARPLLER